MSTTQSQSVTPKRINAFLAPRLTLFVAKLCYAASPILLVLVVVNYFGDAACLFHSPYSEMASVLQQGKNITNIPNYDERVFQRHVINGFQKTPDVIVIGSSRSRVIDSEFFSEQVLFNHSVSGASIEDLIAINQMYKSRGFVPQKVVIGIDPWLLNEENVRTNWLSVKAEYNQFLSAHHLSGDHQTGSQFDSKYWQLVSPSYFQNSVKKFAKLGKNLSTHVATTHNQNQALTILSDGAMVYEKRTREQSAADVEAKAQDYVQGKLYRIENFKAISPRLFAEFDLLVQDLRQRRIEVEFLLTPYHPLVYQVVKREYPLVLTAEKTVREYAESNGIPLYGSFDPQQIGLHEADFFDGMHCKKSAIKKIMGVQRIQISSHLSPEAQKR